MGRKNCEGVWRGPKQPEINIVKGLGAASAARNGRQAQLSKRVGSTNGRAGLGGSMVVAYEEECSSKLM